MPDQQQVVVTGPDKKTYKFPPGTTKDKAIAYFKKKGISVGGDSNKTTTPKSTFNPGPDPEKVKESMSGRIKQTGLNSVDILSKELPAAGGAIYGMAAGSKKTPTGMAMAGLGGMAGAAGNEIIQRLVFNRSGTNTPTGSPGDTNFQEVKNIVVEGVKQAGLEGVGRGAGEIFFRILNKIPHAEIKNGIRLLPSDLNGGKITKYVEDLLSNLIPSAGTVAKFKAGQNKDVIGATEKLAKGFSRFSGTTEDMGNLLQDTYRSLERMDKGALKQQAKNLANPKDIYKTVEYAAYVKNFKTELAKKIALTNKPELIGGYLRSASSLQETRDMMSLLQERGPKVANAVRTRLMRDTLQEALTGKVDPVLKSAQKADSVFSGTRFKEALDKIGEDKLKAIYGEDRYKAIEDFATLVKHVGGSSGSGVGKFLNLIFLIGPLRSGVTLKTGQHIATEGLIFNRAAKIITNPQGVKLYENWIRAGSVGSVKAISAARDALKTYSDQADAEYIQEQKDVEEQYYKEHPEERVTNK